MRQFKASACSRNYAAFTLVEVTLVLGIMGLILGAIWAATATTNDKKKANDALQELQIVSQNVNAMMMGRSFSYAVATNITSTMITSQAIPGVYANGTKAGHPWDTTNFIVTANPTGANARVFRISFMNVGTLSGCVSLLTQGTACQAGQSGCPSSVQTDSGTDTADGVTNNTVASGANWSVSMTVAKAETMCGANAYPSGGGNSVEFDYTL